jgi:hypothetical protein
LAAQGSCIKRRLTARYRNHDEVNDRPLSVSVVIECRILSGNFVEQSAHSYQTFVVGPSRSTSQPRPVFTADLDHRFDVGPVLRAVEEGLEHGQLGRTQDRDGGVGKRNSMISTGPIMKACVEKRSTGLSSGEQRTGPTFFTCWTSFCAHQLRPAAAAARAPWRKARRR